MPRAAPGARSSVQAKDARVPRVGRIGRPRRTRRERAEPQTLRSQQRRLAAPGRVICTIKLRRRDGRVHCAGGRAGGRAGEGTYELKQTRGMGARSKAHEQRALSVGPAFALETGRRSSSPSRASRARSGRTAGVCGNARVFPFDPCPCPPPRPSVPRGPERSKRALGAPERCGYLHARHDLGSVCRGRGRERWRCGTGGRRRQRRRARAAPNVQALVGGRIARHVQRKAFCQAGHRWSVRARRRPNGRVRAVSGCCREGPGCAVKGHGHSSLMAAPMFMQSWMSSRASSTSASFSLTEACGRFRVMVTALAGVTAATERGLKERMLPVNCRDRGRASAANANETRARCNQLRARPTRMRRGRGGTSCEEPQEMHVPGTLQCRWTCHSRCTGSPRTYLWHCSVPWGSDGRPGIRNGRGRTGKDREGWGRTGKDGEGHGKAGEGHGKAGEGHGKDGEGHGRTWEGHGKDTEGHAKDTGTPRNDKGKLNPAPPPSHLRRHELRSRNTKTRTQTSQQGCI